MTQESPSGCGRKHAAQLAAWGLVVAAGLFLRFHFFHTSVRAVEPVTDEGIAVLQAQDIAHGRFHLLMMGQPYLFPIESYLMAPFAGILPATAFGARVVLFALGLATLALFFQVLRQEARGGAAWWSGTLLLSLPSCYLVTMQSAVMFPGYVSLLLLFAATVLAAGRTRQDTPVPGRWFLATGLLAGLAFSSHMLALCYAVPCVLFAIVAGRAWRSYRCWLPLGLGVALGLLPWLAVAAVQSKAGARVVGHCDWNEFIGRIAEGMISDAAAGACGILRPLFPDGPASHGLIPCLEGGVGLALLVLLLWLAAGRLIDLGRAVRAAWSGRAGLPWSLTDIFLGTAILNLLLFAASGRSAADEYRYLLPLVACLPFLLVALARRSRAERWLAAGAALFLAVYNAASTETLIATWGAPGFATEVAGIASLRPALQYLSENDLHYAVASYGIAHRITFQSGRAVMCTQMNNERFSGWPVPFKEIVDAAPRPAYVFAMAGSGAAPAEFESDLAQMGLSCTVHTAGAHVVYHDFRGAPDDRGWQRVDPRSVAVTASSAATPPASGCDGDERTFWTTDGPQAGGEALAVTWPEPLPLRRAVLVSTPNHRRDYPEAMDVQTLCGTNWITVATNTPGEPDPFELHDGNPVYGRRTRTLAFDGAPVSGIRLLNVKPITAVNWTLHECVFLHGNGVDPSPSGTPTGHVAPRLR